LTFLQKNKKNTKTTAPPPRATIVVFVAAGRQVTSTFSLQENTTKQQKHFEQQLAPPPRAPLLCLVFFGAGRQVTFDLSSKNKKNTKTTCARALSPRHHCRLRCRWSTATSAFAFQQKQQTKKHFTPISRLIPALLSHLPYLSTHQTIS